MVPDPETDVLVPTNDEGRFAWYRRTDTMGIAVDPQGVQHDCRRYNFSRMVKKEEVEHHFKIIEQEAPK
jgi:hypothetical protein